jgi:hypothetical protein
MRKTEYWTKAELNLLEECTSCSDSARQASIKYLLRAKELSLPQRTNVAVAAKISKSTGVRFRRPPNWTDEELNKAIELISDYMRPIAFLKYLEWAQKNNYPARTEISFTNQLSRKGVSFTDSLIITRKNTIAKSLGLDPRTVETLLKRSTVKPIRTSQGIGYNAAKFYRWLVDSGEWIEALHRLAKRGANTIIADWATLLNIDEKTVQSEWKKARESVIKIRPSLTFDWMPINKFSKEFNIPYTTVHSAIQAGRSSVRGLRFETTKEV